MKQTVGEESLLTLHCTEELDSEQLKVLKCHFVQL